MSAVDTYALISLEFLKSYMGFGDFDATAPAIAIYSEPVANQTAATVEVNDGVLTVIITGGANAATHAITLASMDDLTTVAAAINGYAGWYARAIGDDSANPEGLVPLEATDVTDQAKQITLRIVDNSRFAALINGATYAIERYCNRRFASRQYVELYRCEPNGSFGLNQYPVTLVSRIGWGRQSAIDVQCSTATGGGAFAQVNATGNESDNLPDATPTSITLTRITAAAETTATITVDGSSTLSSLVTSIGATTGWSATLRASSGNFLGRSIFPTPSLSALTPDLATFEIPYGYLTSYRFDNQTGVVSLMDSHTYPLETEMRGIYAPSTANLDGAPIKTDLIVRYTAGFSTIPYDLQLACAELCKLAYDGAKVNRAVRSEKIGQYQYEIAQTMQLDVFADRLSRWRRIAV